MFHLEAQISSSNISRDWQNAAPRPSRSEAHARNTQHDDLRADLRESRRDAKEASRARDDADRKAERSNRADRNERTNRSERIDASKNDENSGSADATEDVAFDKLLAATLNSDADVAPKKSVKLDGAANTLNSAPFSLALTDAIVLSDEAASQAELPAVLDVSVQALEIDLELSDLSGGLVANALDASPLQSATAVTDKSLVAPLINLNSSTGASGQASGMQAAGPAIAASLNGLDFSGMGDMQSGGGDQNTGGERPTLNAGGEGRANTLANVTGQATSELQSGIAKPPSFQSLVNAATGQQALGQAMAQATADAEGAPSPVMPTSMAGTGEGSMSQNNAVNAAKDPVLAHHAMTNAGLEIARSALAGRSRFEIKLDPAELGRIEVRMVMDKEKAAARLMIERPETLDMMMRDRAQLERLLSASGLNLEGGIDMQLMDDGQADRGEQFDGMLDEGGSPKSTGTNMTGADGANGTADPAGLTPLDAAQFSASNLNPLALNRMA
jgi:flagellar hook-length control protein FliK